MIALLLALAFQCIGSVVAGRPEAARRFAAGSMRADQRQLLDIFTVIGAVEGDVDGAAGAAALERLQAAADSAIVGAASCLAAAWELADPRGRRWNDDVLRHLEPACDAAVAASRAVRAHRPDATRLLAVADSAARQMVLGVPSLEPYVLSRVWEEAGDLPRALGMARMRVYGAALFVNEASRLRREARLAAATGDTTGAVRVLQRYLALRQDAEAPLIPQRDSVRADLDRLLRR